MNKPEPKPTLCPKCNEKIIFDLHTIIENIIKYEPILCKSCKSNFAFNPVTVFTFLILSMLLTGFSAASIFYMPYLQELKQAHPNLIYWVVSGVFVLTLALNLVFKYIAPTLIHWDNKKPLRAILHYSTLLFSCTSALLITYSLISRG